MKRLWINTSKDVSYESNGTAVSINIFILEVGELYMNWQRSVLLAVF